MTINLLCLGAVGPGSILLAIADRQGLFRKHGVEVRLVPVGGMHIPELTANNPCGYIGAPAAIMRAAEGTDLKILASFDTARVTSCLVVNAAIGKPGQLRGKRLGARVAGARMWLQTVLALEKLGLDRGRDQIGIAEIGDPIDIISELRAGRIDGAVLCRPQCEQLAREGYTILLDMFPCNVHGAPDALVATTALVREHPDVIERIVAGLIEGTSFALSPRQRPTVLETIKTELMVTDSAAAESGLLELLQVVARKPYPSVGRLRDMQRIMAASKPAVLGVSIKGLVYDRIVRKLDGDGFIDRTYAAYGVT